MNFEQFAGLHGIRVGAIVPGRWMRFPTDDKPRNRNGAVKYMGDWGLPKTGRRWKRLRSGVRKAKPGSYSARARGCKTGRGDDRSSRHKSRSEGRNDAR